MALISPGIGRLAEANGRRIVLLLGLLTLPIRGAVFAVAASPVPVVLVQALDGISGASIGVLVPLVTSDIAGRSGHYNLALGSVGFAIGIGATLSTISRVGSATVTASRPPSPASPHSALAACAVVLAAMPETKPPSRPRPEHPRPSIE